MAKGVRLHAAADITRVAIETLQWGIVLATKMGQSTNAMQVVKVLLNVRLNISKLKQGVS